MAAVCARHFDLDQARLAFAPILDEAVEAKDNRKDSKREHAEVKQLLVFKRPSAHELLACHRGASHQRPH